MRFVLVHGAYHGSWCWERLIPELEPRGHMAVAVDLPIGDPSAGLSDYGDIIAESVNGDGTIVVGHSMSLVIPLVAERRILMRLVFLCAYLPEPGLSFKQQREEGQTNPRSNSKPPSSPTSALGCG